jgi:hypothetical protein
MTLLPRKEPHYLNAMTPGPLLYGAQPLARYRDDATLLDARAFADRHGRAFLVFHGNPRPVPVLPLGTKDSSGVGTTDDAPLTAFAVRRRPSSTNPFVGVGRLDGNDVGIPDFTISKFHAFFTDDHNSMWLLQDAGSKNGTSVDGVAVPSKGQGPPTRVVSGSTVRFGSVTLAFLDAASFMQLVARLLR